MQKIIPALWFDHVAKEAVDFYVDAFPDARVSRTEYYPTEGLLDFQKEFAGKVLSVEFTLGGYELLAINAGHEFTINPSISFLVHFNPAKDPAARERLDQLWAALAEGGEVLMPLGRYPFSEHYGWLRDKYDVTWQLFLTRPDAEPAPFIVPTLLFGAEAQDRAREALDYYADTFPGARVTSLFTYPEPTGPATQDSLEFADIELFGQWLAVMDAGSEQKESFNPGVSLMVQCDDQEEIDTYWARLSAVPEAEQCGWCVDKFGVSWQVNPVTMPELMQRPGAFEKMVQMHKIEIAAFG